MTGVSGTQDEVKVVLRGVNVGSKHVWKVYELYTDQNPSSIGISSPTPTPTRFS